MRVRKWLKRSVSVIMTIVLSVSLITAPYPEINVDAAEDLIKNGGFDTASEWKDENGNNVKAQEVVDDIETITITKYENDFSTNNVVDWNILNTTTTVRKLDGEDVLSFTKGGNSYITYYGTKFEAGKTYTVSCRVYADTNTDFRLYNESTGTPIYDYKTAQAKQWTDYSITIETTSEVEQPSTYFGIMDSNTNVYIDDVKIVETETIINTEVVQKDIYKNDFLASNIIGWNISSTTTEVTELNGNNVLSFIKGGNSYITYYGTKFEAGKTYTVSCRVYADTNTDFRLYNESTGTAIFDYKTAQAKQWTDYSITIETTSEVEQPVIYFGIMDSNKQVYIDDVNISCETEQNAKTYTEGIGNCNGNEENNVLVMKEYTYVYQNVSLIKGATYEYSFKAKKDSDSALSLNISEDNTEGERYSLTNEWTTYTGKFVAKSDISSLGIKKSGDGRVFLDDITLIKYKEPVVVTDHTSQIERVENNLISNGDFTDDSGFNLNNNVIKDGMLVLTQSYVQKGFEVVAGNKYRLTYYIWVCDSNNLEYDMFKFYNESPDETWADFLLGQDYIENSTHSSSITSDTEGWTKVSFEWTADRTGIFNIGFRMYSGTGTVYMDDLSVVDITPKKEITVQASVSGIIEADGWWYVEVNIPKNEITEEKLVGQNGDCEIEANGVATLVKFNFASKEYATFSGATDYINAGHTLKIPDKIKVQTTDYDVTVDFRTTTTIEKLGEAYGIYTKEHNYPNNDNKFYYNIDNGTKYTFSSTNNAIKVTKNGIDIDLKAGDGVTDTGAYDVERIENNEKFLYKVVLYKNGDSNGDGTINIKDLVAAKCIEEDKGSENIQGEYAADVNRSGKVDKIDLVAIRRNLSIDDNKELVKTKWESALNGVMPIIGYDGPDYDTSRGSKGYATSYVTDEIFGYIKELGINSLVFNRNDVSYDLADLGRQQLELSEKYGLKAYMSDTQVSSPSGDGTPMKSTDDLEARNAKYDMYNSFGGYYIADEPLIDNPTYFSKNRPLIKSFETQLGYIKDYSNVNAWYNLFPIISSTLNLAMDYNPSGVSRNKYKEYMNAVLDSGVEMLCYDLYLRDNNGESEDMGGFYENIDEMRTKSKESGVPFMAFVQAGTYFDGEKINASQSSLTTVQEMYLEANAPLAMGAKGINYYSVIQILTNSYKKDGSVDLYRSGLINVEGKPNHGENNNPNYDYYNAAIKINKYIAKIDEVLMNSDSVGIISTDSNVNDNIDNKADKLTAYGAIKGVSGNNALVGCFDYYGKDVYMVVNTSISKSTTINLNIDEKSDYTYIGMEGVQKNGKGSLELNIPAGESVLVVMD